MNRIILLSILILFLYGCAHVISKDLRVIAHRDIPISDIMKNPDAHIGKIIIIGGTIASSINTAEGTYIEVVQKPLDYRGAPEDTDVSYGRFIIFYEGYLDTAIYSPGREVTVAGEVMGKRIQRLGEMQYPYLLVRSKEIHLFKYRPLPIRFEIGIWHTF